MEDVTPRRVLSVDIGAKNMAVCGLLGTVEIEVWEVEAVDPPTVEGVAAFFERVLAKFKPDMVVVERQMRQNTVATRLEAMIDMYFHCTAIPLTLCAPTVKLRNALLAGLATLDEITAAKKSYIARKKLAITATCRWLVENEAASARLWTDAFGLHAKKDDLADALLQGLVYV